MTIALGTVSHSERHASCRYIKKKHQYALRTFNAAFPLEDYITEGRGVAVPCRRRTPLAETKIDRLLFS